MPKIESDSIKISFLYSILVKNMLILNIEHFFMIQTICQTYSDIEYESLCVILARNVLNSIKDIKLIDVYLYNRYILVSLQKNNITMIH